MSESSKGGGGKVLKNTLYTICLPLRPPPKTYVEAHIGLSSTAPPPTSWNILYAPGLNHWFLYLSLVSG